MNSTKDIREAADSIFSAVTHLIDVLPEEEKRPQKPEQSMVADEFGRWMTVPEAAAYMGVSEAWLKQRTAQLPHAKLGKAKNSPVRFRKDLLDKWLEAHSS